jgi:succinate dehydrogenase hydrophobic anchor subunit
MRDVKNYYVKPSKKELFIEFINALFAFILFTFSMFLLWFLLLLASI